VGVNNMTPPPTVPCLFFWQYGNDSVMATWHPGCNNNYNKLIMVNCTNDRKNILSVIMAMQHHGHLIFRL